MHLKLNLNCDIKVRLTQIGFQRACDAGYEATASQVDDQGYAEFQLWDFVEIFGSKDIDLDRLVQPFQILVDSADLHGV